MPVPMPIMGSLIKNLGGSIAPGGGYIAGTAAPSSIASPHYLYAPGLGDALGPTLGFGRAFVQGLFLAPLRRRTVLTRLGFCSRAF